MNDTDFTKAPWHLWVVGILSLLFNSGGAYDYTMSQTGNEAYLKAGASQVGVSFEAMSAYIEAFPVWAETFWALGVWGAFLGSILLLFRSRFAFHSFAVSLLGLAVTTVFQYSHPMPGNMNSPFTVMFSLVIWAVILGLIVYARRMTAKGVLR